MDQIYWIEPDGTQHYLLDIPSVAVLSEGISGWEMPPVDHVEERVASLPGARFRRALINPRDLDLPLHFKTDTPEALRARMRDVMGWFYPGTNDESGKLRVITELGDNREINCRYLSGLQGDERNDRAGINWRNVIITFRAHDPYWYDTIPTVTEYVQGAPAIFLGNPFFPLRLTRTNIFDAPIASNLGDVDAWPVWTILGPATSIRLVNLGISGGIIDLTYNLLDGEYLVIDTREDHRTVVLYNAMSLFPYMTANSWLWPLKPGDNPLQIQIAGSGLNTKVTLSYTPKYLSF